MIALLLSCPETHRLIRTGVHTHAVPAGRRRIPGAALPRVQLAPHLARQRGRARPDSVAMAVGLVYRRLEALMAG